MHCNYTCRLMLYTFLLCLLKTSLMTIFVFVVYGISFQCFDTLDWLWARKKVEWWFCCLHIVSSFTKTQNSSPFRYWLTHVVVEKRPLNKCCCSCLWYNELSLAPAHCYGAVVFICCWCSRVNARRRRKGLRHRTPSDSDISMDEDELSQLIVP